ncbi:NAD-dependent epimerase/dehydratase family protein [bacterium]|nr:NAD-dependent epimerase/dehydratase family protein [bacterium]
MKILVTGGAGFIGSHLCDTFIEAGHDVVIVDNLVTGRRENINPEAAFYLMDIRSPELAKVFAYERFDAVCHQAAQMDVRKSVADPLFDADVNVKGSINVFENCARHGVGKVLFASTGGAIYGEQESFPCDETHPCRPVSPYGITKFTTEKYLYYYRMQYGLAHTILRYANVYGPRQNPHGEAGVVAIFTSRLLAGEQPVINGDGGQTRDYVFVGDVARANLLSLTGGENDVFNVGTGIETDVNRLFAILNEETGGTAAEQHGPAQPGEQRRSVISYAKAEKLLGFTPEINLETGLRKTVASFRKR